MTRSLVAILLLGFVVMPEFKSCELCGGRELTTYGSLLRGHIPSEGEAQ